MFDFQPCIRVFCHWILVALIASQIPYTMTKFAVQGSAAESVYGNCCIDSAFLTSTTPTQCFCPSLCNSLYQLHSAVTDSNVFYQPFNHNGRGSFLILSLFNTGVMGSSPKEMSKSGNVCVSLLSGVIAGVAAATISHPADTLLSKINKAGAGGTGGMMSRLSNIAAETGFVTLCTQGLFTRWVMIGTLTAGQFGVFDIVMDAVGAKKFHFHDPKAAH